MLWRLVLRAVSLEAFQLVAAGAECAGRRMFQRGDRGSRFPAGVDQVLGQRADDAVAACVHLADLVLVLARCLDHAGGRCVDHRGNAARLCVEGIHLCHD